jgi:ATP-binding cassette subfamily B protein
MMAFAIGSLLTAFVVAWAGAMLSSSHSAKMRKAIYERVGDFSLADIKKFSVPSLITRSTNDVTYVRMFIAIAIQVMVRVPIVVVWAILRMTNVSWELSLITALAVGAIALVTIIIVLIALPKFKKIQENTDKLNLESRENLTGIRVVRAYNAEGFEQAKFNRTNERLAMDNLFLNRAMGIAMPFIMLIMSVLTVAIYWAGSWMLDSGRVQAVAAEGFFADVMVFMQYSFQIIGSFIMMIMVFTMLPGAVVSARRINEVLATKPTIVNDARATTTLNEAFKFDGTIRFNAVDYKYPGAEEKVLSDINIEIKRGQTVAFIGSTGCGKSTLVNLLPRIADPTLGKVTIGGVDVHDVTLEELNDFVG